MTVCFHTTGSGVSRASLSCTINVSAGLKLQSPGSFRIANPNLNFELYNKVRKTIQSGKPSHRSVRMMAFGTPVLRVKGQQEGTWQYIDIWNALYRDRIIWIGKHINDMRSNELVQTMLYIDAFDSSAKMIFFIAAGGDIYPALAVYDTMRSLKSPIATHCVGSAPNMGGFLLSAGDKGDRTAGPLSTIELESPSGAARGRVDEILDEASSLVRVRNYLFEELANKTGQPIDKIYADIKGRKRFTAEAALEYGIIDRIVKKFRDPKKQPRKYEQGLD